MFGGADGKTRSAQPIPAVADEDIRLSHPAHRSNASPSRRSPKGSRIEAPAVERVLILGDDIGIFLAVARSLGRRGIEVHVVASSSSAPGLASRYIARVHSLPSYAADPTAWLHALQNLVAEYKFRLVLPCSDCALLMLNHHAESLSRETLALPNPQALARFTDKVETRALAQGLNVPVAEGELTGRKTDPAELAARLGLPLVLKPRTSYLLRSSETKRSARIVRDLDELKQALMAAPVEGWLAEAFFHGEGVGLSVLADRGQIKLAWQHQRRKAFSETGASTVRSGAPLDPRLLSQVRSLAEAVELSGIAMFEFRCNAASGEHILLEVNPRFWGSLPLAVAAGVDFPSFLWDMKVGNAERSPPKGRIGVTKRNMTGEFDRLSDEIDQSASAGRKLLSVAATIGLCATLASRARFDTWAADDPAPFFAERRQLARRLLRGFVKRLS